MEGGIVSEEFFWWNNAVDRASTVGQAIYGADWCLPPDVMIINMTP